MAWKRGLCSLITLTCVSLVPVAVARDKPADTHARYISLPNSRPRAFDRAVDLGVIRDVTELSGLAVHLRRSAQSEAELNTLIDQQHNPRSPNYRLWLTAKQLDELYGPDRVLRTELVAWMKKQGLRNVRVSPAGMDIKFDATAGELRNAFGTEMHRYSLGGTVHMANASAPRMPSAFAELVSGIYPLNDIKPTPQYKRLAAHAASALAPQLTVPLQGGGNYFFMSPQDFLTMYNVKSAWSAGTTGINQTITVAEGSDVLPADWQSFRTSFGLSSYAGQLVTVHPGCTAPGQVSSMEFEAALDSEWASVAAPDATIQVASCPDTATSSGVFTAIENLLNSDTPPAILSFSFGTCESALDQGTTNYVNSLWQQAAAEGTSVFVSSGDYSSDWCEMSATSDYMAHTGLSVNALAASPYAVAVGGTTVTPELTGQASQYWDQTRSTASNYYQSALSYIPEMAWNDTCGNPVEAASWGYSDTLAFCNDGFFSTYYGAWGTGGGNSVNVLATPSWQSGVLGAPVAGTRGIPDVALFSGGFAGGSYMLACVSSSAPCDYSQDGNVFALAAYGTSFSAPSFAGIQALINQKLGTRQGNSNYAFYQIGRLEYNSSAAGYGSTATCNSSLGSSVAATCVFIDTTQGGNAVPCAPGSANCFSNPGQSVGLLSQSLTSFVPAFNATAGWDYTTGLGTVNVANLVAAMADVDSYVSLNYVDGDENGDGGSDVFFVGSGELGRWILHRTEIAHSVVEPSQAGDTLEAMGDLDGDGKADLVWLRSDGTVTVWLSRGEDAYAKSSPGIAPLGTT